MGQSSTTLHEEAEQIGPECIDRHRAIVSLMEELEAVDWYDQRVHAAADPELKEILAHNRDEEKEHATMVLEWLRRHDDKLSAELQERLFKDGPIAVDEPESGGTSAESAGGSASAAPTGGYDGSLGIGSLKGIPKR